MVFCSTTMPCFASGEGEPSIFSQQERSPDSESSCVPCLSLAITDAPIVAGDESVKRVRRELPMANFKATEVVLNASSWKYEWHWCGWADSEIADTRDARVYDHPGATSLTVSIANCSPLFALVSNFSGRTCWTLIYSEVQGLNAGPHRKAGLSILSNHNRLFKVLI